MDQGFIFCSTKCSGEHLVEIYCFALIVNMINMKP